MSLAFANPAGLAVLAALPLPILLHLARRTEQRLTMFAALAWIGRRLPPRQRIHLAEWLLLALRLLLIVAIACWWAAPEWRGPSSAATTVVLVARGVEIARLTAPLPEGERHWLAAGFPSLDTPEPARASPVASLLREFDATAADGAKLVVVVPEWLDGLDGGSLQLRHAVQWTVVAARTPAEARESSTETPPATTIALRYRDADAPAIAVLRAAVAAWNATEAGRYRLDAAAAPAPIGSGSDWLFAVDGDLDATGRAFVEAGGTALALAPATSDAPVAWRDGDGRVLARARRIGRGRLVELAAMPMPSSMPIVLEAGFPSALNAVLRDAAVAPARAPASAIAPTRDGVAASAPPGRPLQGALALTVALLFVVERTLANGPRLRGAA